MADPAETRDGLAIEVHELPMKTSGGITWHRYIREEDAERIRQQAYAEALTAAADAVRGVYNNRKKGKRYPLARYINWIEQSIGDLTPPAIPQRERLTGEKLREIAKCNCVVREVTWAMCRFNWDAIALKVEAFMRGDAIAREVEREIRK